MRSSSDGLAVGSRLSFGSASSRVRAGHPAHCRAGVRAVSTDGRSGAGEVRLTGHEAVLMLRLRAFGSAAVERDGVRLEGLSGQRKAVALLALLAVAGER